MVKVSRAWNFLQLPTEPLEPPSISLRPVTVTVCLISQSTLAFRTRPRNYQTNLPNDVIKSMHLTNSNIGEFISSHFVERAPVMIKYQIVRVVTTTLHDCEPPSPRELCSSIAGNRVPLPSKYFRPIDDGANRSLTPSFRGWVPPFREGERR